jgi:hypothetical protein
MIIQCLSRNAKMLLPSGQKLTLGLLATTTLEVVPFRSHAPFPAFLPFLNAPYEGVQHRLRFCLGHLNCVKMTAFKFGKSSTSTQLRDFQDMVLSTTVAFCYTDGSTSPENYVYPIIL